MCLLSGEKIWNSMEYYLFNVVRWYMVSVKGHNVLHLASVTILIVLCFAVCRY